MSIPEDRGRRRLIGAAGALVVGAVLPSGVGAVETPALPIQIGLLPYMPTAKLITGHQSLRAYFESHFKRPVELSTAPDFHTFQQRVLAGEFDFTIIGPGPAWQAWLDRKQPIVGVADSRLRIYVLVAKNSPLKSLADLRGKTLATIDPLTVTAQMTMAMLRERKIEPGKDIQVRHDKTPFNCAQAVTLGDVAAAGFPSVAYPNLPPELRDKLRILMESEEIPGVIFTVRPKPGMPAPEQFQAALLQFANETDAGRAYLKEFNHGGISRPDMKALKALDRFVPETRRLMAVP